MKPRRMSEGMKKNKSGGKIGTLCICWGLSFFSRGRVGFRCNVFFCQRRFSLLQTWYNVPDYIKGPRHWVKDLKPSQSYVFIVRAENMNGIGPPSEMSEVVYTKPARIDCTIFYAILHVFNYNRLLAMF